MWPSGLYPVQPSWDLIHMDHNENAAILGFLKKVALSQRLCFTHLSLPILDLAESKR